MLDKDPVKFAEKFLGANLSPWQKAYLKVLWKYKDQLFLFKRGRR